jgi:uncharacterized protein (TIRG00374 family)
MVGLFFNLFLPSALGGDIVKAYLIGKKSGSHVRAISSVFVDRMLGVAALLSLALMALPFFLRISFDLRLAGVVFMVGTGFGTLVLFFVNPGLARRFRFVKALVPSDLGKRKLSELYDAVSRCRHRPSLLGACYALSFFVQMLGIAMGFVIAKSIGMNVSLLVFALVIPVSAIASMVPSLGGLGVREASVIYFLSPYVSTELAAAYALGFDILIYGFGLVCGILFTVFGGNVRLPEFTSEGGPR